MRTLTHDELENRAAKKMVNTWRLPIVLIEPYAHSLSELPDCVGWDWRPMRCIQIECKTTIGDLKGDKHKEHRDGCGVGRYRYFLCDKEVAQADDIPRTWGLLHICGKQTRVIKKAPDRLGLETAMETAVRQKREMKLLATQFYPFAEYGCYTTNDFRTERESK